MNLLEFNEKLGYTSEAYECKHKITSDDLEMFEDILCISDNIRNLFEDATSPRQLSAVYGEFNKVLGKDVFEDVFYAKKIGYITDGVPQRLPNMLKKSFDKYGDTSPNKAVNAILPDLERYVNYKFTGDVEYTIKDLIMNYAAMHWDCQNYISPTFRPVTSWQTHVTNYVHKQIRYGELYVENTKNIALVDYDILAQLPADAKVIYAKDKGLMYNGSLLRTMNDRIGLVHDEFDLRECK